MGGGLSLESVRSRSERIGIGDRTSVVVVSLENVIRSKEAADRAKDRTVLPILRDTLRVKKALERA